VLALVALSGPGPWAASQAPGELAIRRSPAAAVFAGYERRRLRHALESHRFRRGRWPAQLAELEGERLLPGSALASARGHAYYYRSEGALLLAPER
jgi:hypothetical protein